MAGTIDSTVHSHASQKDSYIDSETTLSYSTNACWITSKYVNKLAWWSLPGSSVFRKWIDHDLKGSGLKRSGRITLIQSGLNGSRYLVTLVAATGVQA